MPRIPQLPDFPAADTVVGTDELPLYQASSDRTYGVTVEEIATYITGGGGGVPEAPADGLYYVRQDAAWVQTLLRASVSTVSGTTQTPATGLDGRYFRCTNAAGCAVTIPTNAAQPFPIGTMLTYEQAGAVAVTFTPAGSVTLNVPAAYQASTAEQFAVVQVAKVGTNEWTLYGHLLPV